MTFCKARTNDLHLPGLLSNELMSSFILQVQEDRAFIANSFFANKVYVDDHAYDFEKLRRWFGAARMRSAGASKLSLLDYELLVVPVNWNKVHWALAVANLKHNYVAFYDLYQVSLVRALFDELLIGPGSEN